MRCKKCGNELIEGAKFCNKCGLKIEENNMKYYKEKIDINRVNLKDINRYKLLVLGFYTGVSLSTAISDKLQIYGYSKEKATNYAMEIEEDFHKKYPLGYRKVSEIQDNYENIRNELVKEYKVENFIDSLGFTKSQQFLNEEEKNLIKKYEEAKEELNIREAIEIHNIVYDLLQRIEENLDSLVKNANEEITYQKQKRAINLLKNPKFIGTLIIYIIIVICFWDDWGAWSILAAPIIMVVATINSEIFNEHGRTLHGDKWDNMTQYEKEQQLKKDHIINKFYKK